MNITHKSTRRLAMAAASLGASGLAAIAGATTVFAAGTLQGSECSQSAGCYGDPDWAAQFWVPQTREDDCTLMSSADVIGQVSGQEPNEGQIVGTAQQRGLYGATGGGPITAPATSGDAIVQLLKGYGVSSSYQLDQQLNQQQDLDQMVRALGSGEAVIALVNATPIWQETVGYPSTQAAGHAVTVTGVDTATGYVFLNDSGLNPQTDPALGDTGREEQVSLSTFEQAWSASDDSMVVTRNVVADSQLAGGGSQGGGVAAVILTMLAAGVVAGIVVVRRRGIRNPAPAPAPAWSGPGQPSAEQAWMSNSTQQWPAPPALPPTQLGMPAPPPPPPPAWTQTAPYWR
ncbi:MAG: C39 family peptidase [Candidatus Dormiibacterota bacterium]